MWFYINARVLNINFIHDYCYKIVYFILFILSVKITIFDFCLFLWNDMHPLQQFEWMYIVFK